MGIQVEVTSDADKATKELTLLEAALRRIKAMSFNINIKTLMSQNDIAAANNAVNKVNSNVKQTTESFQSFGKSSTASLLPLDSINTRLGNINKSSMLLKRNQIDVNSAMLNTAASTLKVEQAIQRASDGFGQIAASTAAIVAAGTATTGLVAMLDSVTNIKTQISLAVDDQSQLQDAIRKTKSIAIDTRTSIADISELYSKLSTATKSFNRTQNDVAIVTATVAKAISMSGASTQASSAAVIQLGQALGSGTLQGDELRSILENAPALAQALADGIGVSIGALKKLGASGQLQSETVFKALLQQADMVDLRFKTAGVTYAQSFTVIGSAIKALTTELSGALFDDSKKTIPSYIVDIGKAIYEISSRLEFQVLKLKTEMFFLFENIRSFIDAPFQIKLSAIKLKLADILPDMSAIKSYAIEMAVTLRDSFTSAIGKLVSLATGRRPAGYAAGGHIDGAGTETSDSIPAMLSKGEFVVNAKATRKNRRVLQAINSGAEVAHFAAGGPTDGIFERLQKGLAEALSKIKLKIYEVADAFEAPFNKIKELFLKFITYLKNALPSLDTLVAHFKSLTNLGPYIGGGPQATKSDRTFGHDMFNTVMPDTLKAPVIIGLGVAVAGLVAMVTKGNDTLRNIGLGLTFFGTTRILADNVEAPVKEAVVPNILEGLFKLTRMFTDMAFGKPTGINSLTEGSTLTKAVVIDGIFGERGFGGVIVSLGRLALIFAAGRALVGGAALKALTAPTTIAQNAAIAFQANSAERRFKTSDEALKRDLKVIDDLKQVRKDTIADLAKVRVSMTPGGPAEQFGKARAEEIARGGAAPASVMNAQFAAASIAARNAAIALDTHEAATKKSLDATTTATARLKSMSEALRSQAQATAAAAKQGVINGGAMVGGTFGSLIGFNIGTNVAAGMSANTTALERVMATVAFTMGFQMAGSFVGTALGLLTTWIIGAGATLIGGMLTAALAKLSAGLAIALTSPFLTGALIITGALAVAFLAWKTWPWFAKELKEWQGLGERWVSDFLKKFPNIPGVKTITDKLDTNRAIEAAAVAMNSAQTPSEKNAANDSLVLANLRLLPSKVIEQQQKAIAGLVTGIGANKAIVNELANTNPAYTGPETEESKRIVEEARTSIASAKLLAKELETGTSLIGKAINLVGPKISEAANNIISNINSKFYSGVDYLESLNPFLPKKATGGRISGPGTGTSDSIPAMLSNGEFVINAKASEENADLLHAINSGKSVKYFSQGMTEGMGYERAGKRLVPNVALYDDMRFNEALVLEFAERSKVNVAFLHALTKAESGFNRFASSGTGAEGLMQIVGTTGKSLGVPTLEDRRDPMKAIPAAIKHIEDLLQKYDGDYKKVAAAWNQGEPLLNKRLSKDGELVPSNFSTHKGGAQLTGFLANIEKFGGFSDTITKLGDRLKSGVTAAKTAITAGTTAVGAAAVATKDKVVDGAAAVGDKVKSTGASAMDTAKEIGAGVKTAIIKAFPEWGQWLFDTIDSLTAKLNSMLNPPLAASMRLGKTFDEVAANLSKMSGIAISGAQVKSLSIEEQSNLSQLVDQLAEAEKAKKASTEIGNEVGAYAANQRIDELSKAISSLVIKAEKKDLFGSIDFKDTLNGLNTFNDLFSKFGVTLDAFSFSKITSTQIEDLEYTFKNIAEITDLIAKGGNTSKAKKKLEDLNAYTKSLLKSLEPLKVADAPIFKKDADGKLVEGYVSNMQKSFSDGIQDAIKNGAGLKTFGLLLVNTFTNSVIDAFVQGFTKDLFTNVLNPHLTKIFSTVNIGGSDIASGKDGQSGINKPLSKLLSSWFPEDESKMEANREAFMRTEKQYQPELGLEGLMRSEKDTSAVSSGGLSKAFESFDADFKDTLSVSTDSFKSIFGDSTKGFDSIFKSFGGDFGKTLGSLGSSVMSLFQGGGGGLSGLASLATTLFAADGGFVSGRGTATSDSIPAMLSNGEFVVNAAATKEYHALLARINSGKMPKFANGGYVSGSMLENAASTAAATKSTKSSSTSVFNINVTGDVSQQTRREIQQMIPQIATGVNMHNYEQGSRR